MTKKIALLVRTEFLTRVIVDAPADFDTTNGNELFYGINPIIPSQSELENQLVDKTRELLLKEIGDDNCVYPNITDVRNDREMPYDAKTDSK